MRRTWLCAASVLMVTAAAIGAQSLRAPTPAFEVASIKVNNSGQLRTDARVLPGGRMDLANYTLAAAIEIAYSLQDFQIVGGPAWLMVTRFDITASADRTATQDELQLMLRSLLADRFRLAVHTEPREMSIYALTRARSDGKLGTGLRAADSDCVGRNLAAPQPGPASAPTPPCSFDVAGGRVIAQGFPLSRLAGTLTMMLRRVVVDRTGLDGPFDFDLTWTADPGPQAQLPDGNLIDRDGPSIFTALQEQLGLKLELTKGPADVLVIDSADRPTED